VGPQRGAARAGARVPPAPGRAEALRVEERQVAARPRVLRRQRARVLGGSRIPHARGPLARGALLLPGDEGVRNPALSRAPVRGRLEREMESGYTSPAREEPSRSGPGTCGRGIHMADYPPSDGGTTPPPPVPPPPGEGDSGETLPSRGIGDVLASALQIYWKNAAQLIAIVA